MEKNPSNRYQSAAQMLRHLRRLKIDERTVFNIARPAPRTPTSEITLQKTMRHTHDNPESATTAPATATPAPFPTEKHTLGTKPAQKPKTSAPSAVKSGTKTTATAAKSPAQSAKKPVSASSQAAKKPSTDAQKKQSLPRKKSKKKMSYTTLMLVICILILLFAIFGISSLFLSPSNASEPMALDAARISLEQNLLYLKQGIL